MLSTVDYWICFSKMVGIMVNEIKIFGENHLKIGWIECPEIEVRRFSRMTLISSCSAQILKLVRKFYKRLSTKSISKQDVTNSSFHYPQQLLCTSVEDVYIHTRFRSQLMDMQSQKWRKPGSLDCYMMRNSSENQKLNTWHSIGKGPIWSFLEMEIWRKINEMVKKLWIILACYAARNMYPYVGKILKKSLQDFSGVRVSKKIWYRYVSILSNKISILLWLSKIASNGSCTRLNSLQKTQCRHISISTRKGDRWR